MAKVGGKDTYFLPTTETVISAFMAWVPGICFRGVNLTPSHRAWATSAGLSGLQFFHSEVLGWAVFRVTSGLLYAPGADRILAMKKEAIYLCGFLFIAVLNLQASSIASFSPNSQRVKTKKKTRQNKNKQTNKKITTVLERKKHSKTLWLCVFHSYNGTEGARVYPGFCSGYCGPCQERGKALQHLLCKVRR